MAAITICSDFGAQENKVCHCLNCFPSICHEVMGQDAVILFFWILSFKPAFSLLSLSSFPKKCLFQNDFHKKDLGSVTAVSTQSAVALKSFTNNLVCLIAFDFLIPWTIARQAPLSMGFSRQEYWSGLPFPSPGTLLDPGFEPVSPVSPALQVDSLPAEASGKP